MFCVNTYAWNSIFFETFFIGKVFVWKHIYLENTSDLSLISILFRKGVSTYFPIKSNVYNVNTIFSCYDIAFRSNIFPDKYSSERIFSAVLIFKGVFFQANTIPTI